MQYLTKIQAIRRKKGISQCYVNLPSPWRPPLISNREKWWSGKLIPATNCGSPANGQKKETNSEGVFQQNQIVGSDPGDDPGDGDEQNSGRKFVRTGNVDPYLKKPSLSSLRTMRSSVRSSAFKRLNLGSTRLRMRMVLRKPSVVGKMRRL